jgi:hypothetical protein
MLEGENEKVIASLAQEILDAARKDLGSV